MKILEKFILEQYNASKIATFINGYYGNINKTTVCKILIWFRTASTHYLKDIYKLNKFGKSDGSSNVIIIQSMFTDDNGEKIWFVGAKNNKTGI